MKDKLHDKIRELEKRGIIAKVSKPTAWISSLVVVEKPGKMRVCLDPRELNKAIKRPKYPMPTLDEILPSLANAKVFTVLDAKEGFHQVKLDEESSFLTTFWTPFGIYRYLRMPFGIASAPEEYQRRQIEILQGLPGTAVIADDILVYGCDVAEHDRNLRTLLHRARQANLKLNRKKIRLRLDEVTYMGQVLTSKGVRPDPRKVEAIKNLQRPDSKKAVQRLLGCVNYLLRYLPRLADVSEPLRKLTEQSTIFI